MLRPQHLFVELPDAGLRDSFDEDDIIGQPPFRNLRTQKLEYLLARNLAHEIWFENRIR